MRRPKAVCFDMGYTLLRHSPSGADLYHRVLGEAGFELSLDRVEEALVPARQHYTDSVRAGRDFEASMDDAIRFWGEYNEIVLSALGVDEMRRTDLGRLIYTTAWSPENWEPFPEAAGTLERIRKLGVRMAVISNFVDTLTAVCELHGLAPYFEEIVASVEAGAMKPDSRIFARTVRRLDLPASEVWHIGDNYWTDVLGARAAGLIPVLIDREGIAPRVDCLRVESLDELADVIEAAGEEVAA